MVECPPPQPELTSLNPLQYMHSGWGGLDDGDLQAGSEMLLLKYIYFPAQINGCWYQGAT